MSPLADSDDSSDEPPPSQGTSLRSLHLSILVCTNPLYDPSPTIIPANSNGVHCASFSGSAPLHCRPLLYLVSLYLSICSPNSHLSARSYVVPWSLCEVVVRLSHASCVGRVCLPSMPLQQNQPAASYLFPNLASHRRPTSVSCRKNRYCFGSR